MHLTKDAALWQSIQSTLDLFSFDITCINMALILREKKGIYMYKEGDLTAIIALIKEKYTSQNVYLILCVSLIGS